MSSSAVSVEHSAGGGAGTPGVLIDANIPGADIPGVLPIGTTLVGDIPTVWVLVSLEVATLDAADAHAVGAAVLGAAAEAST